MLGLAGVVLRAAGCAFPKPLPELLSLWKFDETSGGRGFADSGPANLPMAIVGTWADLSTASMVQGIGGTSAYTDGSGYATIPANQPDHDLSELTISFYYQRNSAAAKHILLAWKIHEGWRARHKPLDSCMIWLLRRIGTANGVRARHGRRYGDSAGFATGRG